jgi:hypothetical protein
MARKKKPVTVSVTIQTYELAKPLMDKYGITPSYLLDNALLMAYYQLLEIEKLIAQSQGSGSVPDAALRAYAEKFIAQQTGNFNAVVEEYIATFSPTTVQQKIKA